MTKASREAAANTTVTAALIGIALAVFTALGIQELPGQLQAAIAVVATLVAGWIAPSVTTWGLRYANLISAASTVVLGLISWLVARGHMNPDLASAIVGVIVAVGALFFPSTAHPSKVGEPAAYAHANPGTIHTH